MSIIGLRLIVPVEDMEVTIALTYEFGAQGIQWIEEDDGGPKPGMVWILVWHDAHDIEAQIRRYHSRLSPQATVEKAPSTQSISASNIPGMISLTKKYHVHCVGHGEKSVSTADFDAENSHPIYLEWGSGFGLGEHATTRLCATALEGVLMQYPRPRMADIGTGTGILSILAALEGASVSAIDIEDISRAAARENAHRNHVSEYVKVMDTLPETARFQVIVANLYLGSIMMFSDQLHHWIQPNGSCILSGFGPQHLPSVLTAYEDQGWTYLRHDIEDDWVALILRWPSNRSGP